jgi:hypothetical protein
MQSVCCASAPFSKSTSFQLRLVLLKTAMGFTTDYTDATDEED